MLVQWGEQEGHDVSYTKGTGYVATSSISTSKLPPLRSAVWKCQYLNKITTIDGKWVWTCIWCPTLDNREPQLHIWLEYNKGPYPYMQYSREGCSIVLWK